MDATKKFYVATEDSYTLVKGQHVILTEGIDCEVLEFYSVRKKGWLIKDNNKEENSSFVETLHLKEIPYKRGFEIGELYEPIRLLEAHILGNNKLKSLPHDYELGMLTLVEQNDSHNVFLRGSEKIAITASALYFIRLSI